MIPTKATESRLAEAGLLDDSPLTSNPVLEFMSKVLKTPCRKSTRVMVSTKKYKALIAKALVQQVTNGSS